MKNLRRKLEKAWKKKILVDPQIKVLNVGVPEQPAHLKMQSQGLKHLLDCLILKKKIK